MLALMHDDCSLQMRIEAADHVVSASVEGKFMQNRGKTEIVANPKHLKQIMNKWKR